MSFGKKALKGKEIQHKDLQPTLTIPKEAIDQINYLHNNVDKGKEWSGVLRFEILEGNIYDPKNLKLNVKEIIPMDIGTSSYTEYELGPKDKYASPKITDILLSDGKERMGHIHTHHNMSCFFSGVDTAELEENAPNHADFYLSLIVNYDNPSAWCAKVTVYAEEERKITTKSRNKFPRIANSKAVKGAETERTETLSIIHTYPCILVTPSECETVGDAFKNRVKELKTPKSFSSTHTVHTGGYQVGRQIRMPYTGGMNNTKALTNNSAKLVSDNVVINVFTSTVQLVLKELGKTNVFGSTISGVLSQFGSLDTLKIIQGTDLILDTLEDVAQEILKDKMTPQNKVAIMHCIAAGVINTCLDYTWVRANENVMGFLKEMETNFISEDILPQTEVALCGRVYVSKLSKSVY